MAFQLKKATKAKAKLRMAITGPAGGGKTYTSILVAKHLIGEPYKLPDGTPSRIAVIDSERNRAEKYADDFDFEHGELGPGNWSSEDFTNALIASEKACDIVIIDSITHEWKWCLTEVDRIAPKYRNNTWSAWGEVSPKHDAFIDAIMASSAHVIVTMRSKMATVQEKDDRGKTTVRKVGMESVQRDDLDYAFDIVLAMDNEHNGILQKTNGKATGKNTVFAMPGKEFAETIGAWLNSGAAAEPKERQRREHSAAPQEPSISAPKAAEAATKMPPLTVDQALLFQALADRIEQCSTVDDCLGLRNEMLEKLPQRQERTDIITRLRDHKLAIDEAAASADAAE